jgi:hypothetical protein
LIKAELFFKKAQIGKANIDKSDLSHAHMKSKIINEKRGFKSAYENLTFIIQSQNT